MSLKEMLNSVHVICLSAFALFHLSTSVKSLQRKHYDHGTLKNNSN